MMPNDLCEELIVDIFSRLPTKSLLRFRSVSKSLYACIGSPSFIRLHTLRSPEKVMITHKILQKGEEYVRHTDDPTPENHQASDEAEATWAHDVVCTLHLESQFPHKTNIGITPVKHPFKDLIVIGSCNGILLLYRYGEHLILWNPSIRRKVIVRNPPILGNPCVACEFGFGFDPVIDDYKILCIKTYGQCFVYTMKTHTWRAIASPTIPFDFVFSHHCLFNGALHCVAQTDDSSHYIIKFDLCSEVFSKIELPEPSWETSVMSIIKGCLAVMSSKDDKTWIWVMREYCNPSSWYVAFELNECRYDLVDGFYQLNAINDLLLDHFYDGIIAYNPVTHERSKLSDFIDSSSIVCMTRCIESLELLDTGTTC